MIDLHLHTRHSDGSDSVEELFLNAKKINLNAIAITDHDTLKGHKEARIFSKKYNIKFVPGVEITTGFKNKDIHVLGYFLNDKDDKDDKDDDLNNFLSKIRDSRKLRNNKLVNKLNELGYEITLKEVMELSDKKENIGRPHFARLLIEKGYFKSMNDVFDELLGTNKKAHVDREIPSPIEAIKQIHKSRGIAVLAHPFSYGMKRREIKEFINDLIDAGLDGIETIYVSHKLDEINFLKNIAKENNLLITGGSDYHGLFKPKVKLGFGFGNLFVPDILLENLENYKK